MTATPDPVTAATSDAVLRNEPRRSPDRSDRPVRTRPERSVRPDDDRIAAGLPPQMTDQPDTNVSSAGTAAVTPEADARPREKRSRDRYGRERRPRGDRPDRPDRAQSADVASVNVGEEASAAGVIDVVDVSNDSPRKSYFSVPGQTEIPAAATSAPVTTPQAANAESTAVPPRPAAMTVITPQAQTDTMPAAPVATAAPNTAAMPPTQGFALPVDELARVANASGLVWVNSDADKVASLRSAMAAEPQPVHQPRPVPVLQPQDDSPLVLVETKRDLHSVTLPFEANKLP